MGRKGLRCGLEESGGDGCFLNPSFWGGTHLLSLSKVRGQLKEAQAPSSSLPGPRGLGAVTAGMAGVAAEGQSLHVVDRDSEASAWRQASQKRDGRWSSHLASPSGPCHSSLAPVTCCSYAWGWPSRRMGLRAAPRGWQPAEIALTPVHPSRQCLVTPVRLSGMWVHHELLCVSVGAHSVTLLCILRAHLVSNSVSAVALVAVLS